MRASLFVPDVRAIPQIGAAVPMRAGKCCRWHAKGKKEPGNAAVGRDSVPTAAFPGSRMPVWKKGRPVCDRTPLW